MVDLPIPDQPAVNIQAPQMHGAGSGGSYLAAGLQRLSAGVEDIATKAADSQAADDLRTQPVTRDADGTIKVGANGGFPILGAAGAHYEAAIKAGALAQGDNLARQDVTSLASQHIGDPQGMLQAGQSYIANIRARNSGPLGEAMAQRATDMLTQHYDGAVQAKAQNDVAQGKQALVDARTNAFDTLSALAQGGKGPGDPTYDKAAADWKETARSLTSNPAFGISPDVMATNEEGDLAKLKGYAIAGKVDADMRGPGGTEAALAKARDAINDPSLNLSMAERHQMLAMAEARVHFNTMITASDQAGARKDFDAVREAFNKGQISAPTADQLEAMHQKALSLGDALMTKEVEGFRTALANEPARQMLLPAQQRNAQGIGAGSARVGGTTNSAYLSSLASGDVQGALRASEGLRTDAYYDVDHWRTGYGSDSITNADGSTSVVGGANGANPNIKPNVAITQADAERDLARRTADFAAGARQAIGPAWDGLGKGAQAALTSIAYNYGHVPDSVVNAARSGNPQAIADAIAARAGDNNGANSARRLAEAAAVSGKAPIDARGIPFSPQQIRDNPFLLSNWVQSQVHDPENRAAYGEKLAASITRGLDMGFAPDPTAAATLMQLAENSRSPGLADAVTKVQASFEARSMTGNLVNLPPEQREIVKGQIKAMASGNDLYHQQVAEYAGKMVEADEKQIKESPFEYAVARGRARAPAALNPNDPNMLATGLHQRADILDGLGAGGAVSATGSVLDKAGKEQLTDAVAGGTGAQVQNIVSALSTVPEARRAATVADLGPAIMGAANSGDPAKMKAAYGFLGKEFDTNPVSFRKDFSKEAANQLLAYRAAIVNLPPDVASKRVQGWNDPAQQETREGVAKIAGKEIDSLTADQVAEKWSTFSAVHPTTWGGVKAQTPTTDAAATSGEGLHADYRQAYIIQRQLGVPADMADKNARAMLNTKWGVSGVNGNQVMVHPPEAYYDPIGGSHAWIGDQLDAALKDALGHGDLKLPTGVGLPMIKDIGLRNAITVYNAPRAIAADDVTERDLAAGKKPSYYIVTKDENGLWNPLMSQGRAGRSGLIRFYPDPKNDPGLAAAQKQAQYLADQDAAYAATAAERHRKAWTDLAGNYRPPGTP